MVRPALVVHTLDHIRLALRTASDAGRPLTLITPPNAASYAGPAFYRNLLERARHLESLTDEAVHVRLILDCGDDAGLALFALDMGWQVLVLGGHRGARRRVRNIARQHGAEVLASRPAAVDLASAADAAEACRESLKRAH